jgi:hypothetical protein
MYIKSNQTRKHLFPITIILLFFGFSISGFSQEFGFKPTFAYNFHSLNGIQAHTFGGGLNIEESIDETKSTLHFSVLYFGGKGTLTEESYGKWFDDEPAPQDPNKIAKRNNFDMFYISAGQRFYLGDSEIIMDGVHLGYSLGWGLPAQDNPFGYYWDISAQLGYQHFFKDKRSFDIFAKIGFGQWTYDVEYFKVVYGYGDSYKGLNFKSESMFFIQTGVSVGLFK